MGHHQQDPRERGVVSKHSAREMSLEGILEGCKGVIRKVVSIREPLAFSQMVFFILFSCVLQVSSLKDQRPPSMRQVPFPAPFCTWHNCPSPVRSGGRSQILTECSCRFNICHESEVGRRGRDASRSHDFSSRLSGRSSKEDFQKPRSVQRLLLLLQEEAVTTALARVPVASIGFSTSQQHGDSVPCLSFLLNVSPNPALVRSRADGVGEGKVQLEP